MTRNITLHQMEISAKLLNSIRIKAKISFIPIIQTELLMDRLIPTEEIRASGAIMSIRRKYLWISSKDQLSNILWTILKCPQGTSQVLLITLLMGTPTKLIQKASLMWTNLLALIKDFNLMDNWTKKQSFITQYKILAKLQKITMRLVFTNFMSRNKTIISKTASINLLTRQDFSLLIFIKTQISCMRKFTQLLRFPKCRDLKIKVNLSDTGISRQEVN